jgi:hypothetical protein
MDVGRGMSEKGCMCEGSDVWMYEWDVHKHEIEGKTKRDREREDGSERQRGIGERGWKWKTKRDRERERDTITIPLSKCEWVGHEGEQFGGQGLGGEYDAAVVEEPPFVQTEREGEEIGRRGKGGREREGGRKREGEGMRGKV